jgi:hypothetical protein
MVKQSCEPFLPPFPCYFSHTAQSLGHSFPALCRVSVGLNGVLLGTHPFLPRLRRRSLFFVRLASSIVWCGPIPPERARLPYGFGPSRTGLVPLRAEALQRSPGSRACCFSACAGSPTTQDQLLARDCRGTAVMPSSIRKESASWFCVFRSSIARPTDTPVYASSDTSRCHLQD